MISNNIVLVLFLVLLLNLRENMAYLEYFMCFGQCFVNIITKEFSFLNNCWSSKGSKNNPQRKHSAQISLHI